MREIPVLFRTEMVRAILDLIKKQTRRKESFKAEVGDILWVKETWTYKRDYPAIFISDSILYKTDLVVSFKDAGYFKWKSSLFMPKKYARIFLEVIGVRIERLQDISIDDIREEGIPVQSALYVDEDGFKDFNEEEYRYHFQILWDSINGKKEGFSWEDNPKVKVIEFKIKEVRSYVPYVKEK